MTDDELAARFGDVLDSMPTGHAEAVRQISRWVDDFGLPATLDLMASAVTFRAVLSAEGGEPAESIIWSAAREAIEKARAELPGGI